MVQTKESRLDSSGVCEECRRSSTPPPTSAVSQTGNDKAIEILAGVLHRRSTPPPSTSYVVIWIAGVYIVKAGVYDVAVPTSLVQGGYPVTLFTATHADKHKARAMAREWYERNLPSVSRAHPVLTFY